MDRLITSYLISFTFDHPVYFHSVCFLCLTLFDIFHFPLILQLNQSVRLPCLGKVNYSTKCENVQYDKNMYYRGCWQWAGRVVVWFTSPILGPLQITQFNTTLDCGNFEIDNSVSKNSRIFYKFLQYVHITQLYCVFQLTNILCIILLFARPTWHMNKRLSNF